MDPEVRKYLSKIGQKGGLKSRRKLSSEQAVNMVKIRQAKRLFKLYHRRCFWSYDPNYKIQAQDIQWIADQLIKNGDRKMWILGMNLCR